MAQKQPYLQVGTLVSQLDPSGTLFAHDKVEGVATTDGGKTLYLSNDDDFGIDTIAVDPDGKWTVHQKVLPATGQPDNGEILKVDTTKLPAVLKTVTVTIHVHYAGSAAGPVYPRRAGPALPGRLFRRGLPVPGRAEPGRGLRHERDERDQQHDPPVNGSGHAVKSGVRPGPGAIRSCRGGGFVAHGPGIGWFVPPAPAAGHWGDGAGLPSAVTGRPAGGGQGHPAGPRG